MHRHLIPLVVLMLVPLVLGAGDVTTAAGDVDGTWTRVAFEGPITQTDRDGLAATGAQAINYVPDDAYVAFATDTQADAARDLAGVTAVSPVDADSKLDASLGGVTGPVAVSALTYGPAAGSLDTPGAVHDRTTSRAASQLVSIRLTVDAAHLDDLAADRAVLAVSPAPTGLHPEDEGTAQVLAGNAELGEAPPPGYADFLADLGLDGDGVTVSIVDTGIDSRHPEFDGRVQTKIDYSPLPTGEPADTYGHGTHVAGIAGGTGVDIGPLGPATDDDGLEYGQGIAPEVGLVDQNAIALTNIIDTPTSGFPPPGGFETLTADAVEAGAVAWNASWTSGEGAGVGYIDTARTMDALVRDADTVTGGNQQFTMVFSAGNSGPDAQTLTAPKEAKNIISVAASNSHRAGLIDAVAGFSSRGPALDGRTLPVVAAPGDTVASAKSTTATIGCSTGPLVEHGFGLYSLCSGTSMAAPHVTGAVALVHDWWRQTNAGADPSPAMVKALLVNTAEDMLVADIPNNAEGWGRVNLANLFDTAVKRTYVDQTITLDDLGDTHTVDVEAADPSRPLKATLVWTDAPAVAGADPALVNDLDLTVTDPSGTRWLGNVFADGTSTTGGQADRLNNVENVFVDDPADGDYEISVEAANLPGDGMPATGDATDQDFALVVSNARPVGG